MIKIDKKWFGDKITQDMHGGLETAVAGGATIMLSQMQSLTPKRTGALVASETIQFKSPLVATIGPNIEYAPYVEFGTSKQSAQPFVRPTLKYTKNPVIRFAQSIIQKLAK